MWKKGKTIETAGLCASTAVVEEKDGSPRLPTSPGISTERFSFSTGNVEKKGMKKQACFRSVSGCDIGFKLLDHLGKGRVFFHLLLHLADGVDDGGVIPVAEELSDVVL